MPKFFFDTIEIDGTVRKDTVGLDLSDANAAHAEAQRCLADMTLSALYKDMYQLRVEVRDEHGRRIALKVAYLR